MRAQIDEVPEAISQGAHSTSGEPLPELGRVTGTPLTEPASVSRL
jgi:hypothetical protein